MSCPGRFVSCLLSLLGSWLLATFNACVLSLWQMGFSREGKGSPAAGCSVGLVVRGIPEDGRTTKSEYRIKPKKKNKKKSIVSYVLIFGQYQDIVASI